jgi:MFS family permease
MTTLPLFLSTLRATEVEIGVLIGSQSVASLLLRPVIGRRLLSRPERSFMIGGSLLFAVSSGAYLVASPFWPFLLVRVFQGVGMAAFNTASVTLIANISSESSRGKSLSYFFLSFNTALALAPTFAMFMVNHFGFKLLFAVCIALSLGSLATARKLEKREPTLQDREPVSTENEYRVGIKIFPPIFMFLVAHIIWGALSTFFPLYAVSQGVSNPGFFFGAYAVVLILCRGLGGGIIDLYPREKLLLPCLALITVGMTLLAFSKTLLMFMVVAVIAGVGHAFLMPCLMAYAIDLAGVSRGPAMGLITAMGDLGMGIGPVLLGIVLRFSNFPVMFLSVGLISFSNFVYYFLYLRKAGKPPAEPIPS